MQAEASGSGTTVTSKSYQGRQHRKGRVSGKRMERGGEGRKRRGDGTEETGNQKTRKTERSDGEEGYIAQKKMRIGSRKEELGKERRRPEKQSENTGGREVVDGRRLRKGLDP